MATTSKHKTMQKKIYQCRSCKLFYKEEKWAEKCERWCQEHGSCNFRIIKHAVLEKK